MRHLVCLILFVVPGNVASYAVSVISAYDLENLCVTLIDGCNCDLVLFSAACFSQSEHSEQLHI